MKELNEQKIARTYLKQDREARLIYSWGSFVITLAFCEIQHIPSSHPGCGGGAHAHALLYIVLGVHVVPLTLMHIGWLVQHQDDKSREEDDG